MFTPLRVGELSTRQQRGRGQDVAACGGAVRGGDQHSHHQRHAGRRARPEANRQAPHLGLAAIVAATFTTVATSVLNGRIAPAKLARIGYIACSVLVVLFVGANAVLLAVAALAR